MTDPQAADQTCDFEAMSALAPQHDLFKPFQGTFRATVSMFMGPGDPMVVTGTMVNESELDGRFLKQTYSGDPNEGPFPTFNGRGWWGYNTVDQRFEGVWIDSACTFMLRDEGQVDDSGKVWHMQGRMTDPSTGKPMVRRSVITLVDENTHVMEMFHHPEGGEECKTMEIRYERA